jgi:hypothetical protein
MAKKRARNEDGHYIADDPTTLAQPRPHAKPSKATLLRRKRDRHLLILFRRVKSLPYSICVLVT